MRLIIGESDPYRHDIEKGGRGQGDALGTKVVTYMEQQFIFAAFERNTFKQGFVAATVVVGYGGNEQCAAETKQFDPYSRCRAAIGSIENMSRQLAHQK